MKTAIIAGTSGLIGSQLLELLVKEQGYDKVIALSRNPLKPASPKLQNLVVNFDALWDYADRLRGDDVFCCLGTTMKRAGSKEAFRTVDFEYPVALASITKEQGARQFLIVTASGANKDSLIFYNRVKGEVQESIVKIGFEAIHILQPSLLIGHRTEKRAGEGVATGVMKVLDILIPKKNKAIDPVKVARAMVDLAKKGGKGTWIHDSGELQNF